MTRPTAAAALLVAAVLAACGGETQGGGPVQRVSVPPGAPFSQVADTLEARGLVDSPFLLRLRARVTGAASQIQAGTYEFQPGTGYRIVLDDLVEGNIAQDRFVVPEAFSIRQFSPALADDLGLPAASVTDFLLDTATAARFDVPGPTLEGYLYPATYVVPAGAPLDSIVARMVRAHQSRWTRERQTLADATGLSHHQVVTLASIVEKEARIRDEMPLIAAVYRNRLDIGYPLQADPTVQYALGEHQPRLLYAHIDSVADHPYNTYTRLGLPPGPIGAVSEDAMDAVLQPADVDYLYFVARPDGSHIFNRHLVDHNRARQQVRRESARSTLRSQPVPAEPDTGPDSETTTPQGPEPETSAPSGPGPG